MAEKNKTQGTDVNEQIKVRMDKLKALQEAGKESGSDLPGTGAAADFEHNSGGSCTAGRGEASSSNEHIEKRRETAKGRVCGNVGSFGE